jgi:nucleoside 2-deoxyribosyltransferase
MPSVELDVRVTVSGSFRKAMSAVQQSVAALTDAGAIVLSPSDPRVVDEFGDFLFVASDRLRVIRTIQDRHLAAIAASNLLWVVCPDGYIGPSTATEIGFALAKRVPIMASTPPSDLTLRQYVHTVRSEVDAIAHAVRTGNTQCRNPDLLLDPEAATDHAHRQINQVRDFLLAPSSHYAEAQPQLHAAIDEVRAFGQPLGSTAK